MQVREATLGAWKIRVEIPHGVDPDDVDVEIAVHSDTPETTIAAIAGHEHEAQTSFVGGSIASRPNAAHIRDLHRGDVDFELVLFPDARSKGLDPDEEDSQPPSPFGQRLRDAHERHAAEAAEAQA